MFTDMNSLKQKYLDRIRSDSAYPAFRGVVNIITLLFYVFGALLITAAILQAIVVLSKGGGMGPVGIPITIFAIAFGLFGIVLGKVVREISLMLADVADSITDLNSRNEGSDHLGKTAAASEAAAASSQASADLLRQLIRAYGHEPEV
jgi:hypothetical protein